MLNAGTFDDIAATVMIHPGPIDIARARSLALSQVDVTYRGKEAHAAVAPYLGVNAADAITVAQTAIGLLRQQFAPGQMAHGIVTDGGQAANVIPARAVLQYTMRATDADIAAPPRGQDGRLLPRWRDRDGLRLRGRTRPSRRTTNWRRTGGWPTCFAARWSDSAGHRWREEIEARRAVGQHRHGQRHAGDAGNPPGRRRRRRRGIGASARLRRRRRESRAATRPSSRARSCWRARSSRWPRRPPSVTGCSSCTPSGWRHDDWQRPPTTGSPHTYDELVAWRRHIHAHPELGRQEFATTQFVASHLADAGLNPKVLPGGTGLICDFGPEHGPRIALRADMDALPMAERTGCAVRVGGAQRRARLRPRRAHCGVARCGAGAELGARAAGRRAADLPARRGADARRRHRRHRGGRAQRGVAHLRAALRPAAGGRPGRDRGRARSRRRPTTSRSRCTARAGTRRGRI